MGVVLPIIMIIASCVGSGLAIYAAVTLGTALTIALAVVACAATVASVVLYVQGDVKNSMLFAGIGIAAGIGAGYIAVTNALEAQEAAALAYGAGGLATSVDAYSAATLQVYGYLQSIHAAYSEVMNAIHFRTIMAVHQLAYMVSADYRNMMAGVFSQIRAVSYALGYGADFMENMLRITRTTVLDVSATMGKRYDLAELTWASTLSDFLKRMGGQMDACKDNPQYFLALIEDSIMKPALDTKGVLMQAMLSGVDRAIEGAKILAQDVTLIRNDVMKLVGTLPEIIRVRIQPELNKIVKQFDDFMKLNYDPTIKAMSKAFETVGKQMDERKKETAKITDRIARPGKYLQEIKSLPAAEAAEDRDAIFDLAFGGVTTDMEDLTATIRKEYDNLIELARAEYQER